MSNAKKTATHKHPSLHQVDVTCSCGHTMVVRSVIKDPFQVETCSRCHNAYTGENRQSHKGRAEKFLSKYNQFSLRSRSTSKPANNAEKKS